MLPVACALGAALLYAVASVLQQRVAGAEPDDQSMRLSLLARLLRRPLWLAGVAADAGAFGLQFTALATGPLVLVQPLLVSSLLFALPLGAWLAGDRPRRIDLVAAAAVCAGLALFLTVANPAAGHSFVRDRTWLELLTAAGCLCGALALAAGRRQGPARSVLLSACAGITYGVAAGLTKTTGQLLALHRFAALLHWQVWALVLVGGAGLVIGQSAFQAGSLDVSLPTMTVVDPVVSVMVGALAFGETITHGTGEVVAEVAGLAVTVAGVYVLGRSPAIRHSGARSEPEPGPA